MMMSIAIVSVTSGSPLKADKLELPGMKLKISKPALQNAETETNTEAHTPSPP